MLLGNFERYLRLANFSLAPDNPLRHSRRRSQKRAGNFFGSEGANLTQGQSCANVEAQRGMTTREDQPEHIVLNLLVYVRWIRRIRFHLPYLLHLQGIKFRLATETV